MRFIADLLIGTGIVVSAVAFWAGYHVVGIVAALVVLIVGWRRVWCRDSVEDLWESSLDGNGDSGGGDSD